MKRSLIPKIKEKVTLEDVFDALDATYREATIVCPFPDHQDSHPSCYVRGEWFECFGCGRKGDAIDFVEGMRQCTKAEAIEWIARRFKLVLPGIDSIEDLHHAIHQLAVEPIRGPSKFERNQFVDDEEAKIRRLWDLYLQRWQSWAYREWPVWETEIEWRLRRVRDWAINRNPWPGVPVLRDGYVRIRQLAIETLRGPHRANLFAEGRGVKPELLRKVSPVERATRQAEQFCQIVEFCRDELGVDPADLAQMVDRDFAAEIRLFRSVEQLDDMRSGRI